MKKTTQKYKEKLLYPGLLHRRISSRLFRRYGGRFFIYSAFPKSASTYLVAIMSSGFGENLKVIRAKTGLGLGHSFISEEKLIRDLHYRKDILLYGHIPWMHSNMKILKRLTQSPKVIITIRPLADIIISYKEHIDKIGHGPLDYYIDDLPECHPQWHLLEDEKKFDFLIQYIIPWYVRFVTGWQHASKTIPVEFITFEEHTLYPKECVKNISTFFNLDLDPVSNTRLNDIDRLPKANLNVGRRGRGFTLLTKMQLAKINEIVSLSGDAFSNSFLGRYLCSGFEGAAMKLEDIIEMKNRLTY
jgi:hypothetical protein